MAELRTIDRRELVIRVFPPRWIGEDRVKTHESHVFRIGVASGKAVPACKQGEWLLNKGFGYWQYPPIDWILDNAPICPDCIKRLEAEGIIKK